MPVRTYPLNRVPEAEPYRTVLDRSFRERYRRGDEPWTAESEMRFGARLLLSHLPKGKARVLDIGTGAGRDVATFAEAGHRAVGIDRVAHHAWPALRQRFGERVRLLPTTFLQWRSGRRRFEGILDGGCFHHQHPDDYARYLEKVRVLLAPGGLALICVFTPNHPRRKRGYFTRIDGGRLNRYFTARELRALVEKAGLRWVSSTRVRRPSLNRFYLYALVRK